MYYRDVLLLLLILLLILILILLLLLLLLLLLSKKGHLGHAQGPRVLMHFTRAPCDIELRSASQVRTANMIGSFGKQVCVVCTAETHFHTTKVGIKPIEVLTYV